MTTAVTGNEAENTLNQPIQSQKHVIWMRELEYSIFLLKQRRAEQEMGETRNLTPSNQLALETREQGEIQPHLHANSMLQTSLTHWANTASITPTQIVNLKRSSTPVIKFIPGLPKIVEKAVKLWRRGSEREGYKPVRLFEKVETRRILIPNYENRIWARSGQKNCFFPIKAVAELVSEFGPVTIRLDSEGRDEHWNTALENYHAHFDKNGKPISLSSALLQSNDI